MNNSKETENNLLKRRKRKKTLLKNIEKGDVKKYINKIIKINKDIKLYKVFYNDIDKTLLIVADRRIQIYKIFNRIITPFKSIKDLKEELDILSKQNNLDDEDHLNLSTLKTYFGKIVNNFYDFKKILENSMEKKLMDAYGEKASISIYEYNNNYIRFGFTKNYQNRKYKSITIKNTNNNISIINSEIKESEQIIKLLKNDLISLFNIEQKFQMFNSEYNEKIRCTNANFYVDISLYSIIICSKNFDNINFKIKYNTYDNTIIINCDDKEINNYLEEKASYLLNLIYIPIIECPEWSQEYLYDIREDELNFNTITYKIKKYRK